MKVSFPILEKFSNSFMMGDFNFHSTWPEQKDQFLFSFPIHIFGVFAAFQFLFTAQKAPTDFYNPRSFSQFVLPKFQ